MDLGLAGKKAFVMGSTGGMGEGIARRLSAEGASVMISGRSIEKGSALAAQIGNASFCHLDLSMQESIDEAIKKIESEFGSLDILVCNGGGPPPGPIVSVETQLWQAQFETMFTNQVKIVNAYLSQMREKKWGRVLVVSSSGIQQPIPNLGISNSIRAAQVGWAKTLAGEVAADGVTVNICAPGRIHTDRVNQIDEAAAERQGRDIEDVRAESRATIPMARYGEVAEFADTAVFLLSANASYITGSIIRVDGGMIRGV